MTLPDTADLDSYISVAGLVDYLPVTDPETDIGATGLNELLVDAAGLTHTGARAYVVFTWDGAAASVTEHDAVWGDDPSVIPTATRTGQGLFTISWPSTVTDPLGNGKSVNLRRAISAYVSDDAARWTVQCLKPVANEMDIAIFDDASGSNYIDPTGVEVVVWVR